MLGLSAKTLQTIKKHLIRKQKEVEKELLAVEGDDPATSPALAETSEPGTDSWLADAHARTLALRGQLINAAQSVKKALLKIRKKTYGICDNCGKQIEAARLEVMPTASLCLSCSSTGKK